MISKIKLKLLSFGVLFIVPLPLTASPVTINEIHYDEDDKTLRAEFIEIYNNSDENIDISFWYFSDGYLSIFYSFLMGWGIFVGQLNLCNSLLNRTWIPVAAVKPLQFRTKSNVDTCGGKETIEITR